MSNFERFRNYYIAFITFCKFRKISFIFFKEVKMQSRSGSFATPTYQTSKAHITLRRTMP